MYALFFIETLVAEQSNPNQTLFLKRSTTPEIRKTPY